MHRKTVRGSRKKGLCGGPRRSREQEPDSVTLFPGLLMTCLDSFLEWEAGNAVSRFP